MAEDRRQQIPAIIHYCWFGHGKMPASAVRCIESWKRLAPGFILRRWDESSFDVGSMPYTDQAYRQGKYAFVSDVARLHALVSEGGVYLDTDVELLKSPDRLIKYGATIGFESSGRISTAVISAEKGSALIKEFLATYTGLSFLDSNGCPDLTPNTVRFTEFLKAKGLRADGTEQKVAGLTVLPHEILSPLNQEGYRLDATPRTICIHHFDSSWESGSFRLKKKVQHVLGPTLTINLIKLKRRIKSLSGNKPVG